MTTTFDVRKNYTAIIEEIRFSDETMGSYTVAHKAIPFSANQVGQGIKIHDSSAFVIIKNKEHAANLRLALDKAEELGWLK